MNRHTMRLLGAAIAVGALLLAGVTAVFAANGPASTFVSRMMGGSGRTGMMNGYGNSGMMTGAGDHGMVNGQGTGGMRSGSCSAGMMGSWAGPTSGAKTITIAQARQNVQRYIDRSGHKHLAIDEVIEFQRNFYAVVNDKSTGHGALEVLVNKVTGAVFPEPGPAMMWNTQYGMMSGGMSGMMGYQQRTGPMTVSATQAERIAQEWLAQHKASAASEAADQFPGYYTIHFLQHDKIAGMLSVNGYTGQVWYHSWHGKAIKVLEVSG